MNPIVSDLVDQIKTAKARTRSLSEFHRTKGFPYSKVIFSLDRFECMPERIKHIYSKRPDTTDQWDNRRNR